MPFLLGAYAALSSLSAPPSSDELARFYGALAGLPEICGLEVPFYGLALTEPGHPSPPRFWAPHWDQVLTTLPGTMNRIAADPRFGLASTDEKGRRAAIDFVAAAREAIRGLAVSAVEIHSAPRGGPLGFPGSEAALTESLREIRGWDWGQTRLWLEHCDRYRPEWPPAKGFLPLEAEIAAIRASDPAPTVCGISLNWARSAIEARSFDEPIRHLELATQAGQLAGFIYSGCTENDAVYGHWADTHAPLPPQVVATLGRLIGSPVRLGLKVQVLPAGVSLDERGVRVRNWIDELSRWRKSC